MKGEAVENVAFVDTETTGLDPERHEIWELALIAAGKDGWDEWEFQLPVDLSRADPTGLRIGRFYERRLAISGKPKVGSLCRVRWPARTAVRDDQWHHYDVMDAAQRVAALLDGKHMVGAVPSFDAAFLAPWLRKHGQAPTWHYHLVDCEALAAGRLGRQPPWDSEALSSAVGVDPSKFDRHTALGDARWAKAIYDAVMGQPAGDAR